MLIYVSLTNFVLQKSNHTHISCDGNKYVPQLSSGSVSFLSSGRIDMLNASEVGGNCVMIQVSDTNKDRARFRIIFRPSS